LHLRGEKGEEKKGPKYFSQGVPGREKRRGGEKRKKKLPLLKIR